MTALTWTHAEGDVPDTGLEVVRTATPDELKALAAELGIRSCDGLRAEYSVRRIGAERYLLSGTVAARITQACVISLEPVEQRIDEQFAVELGPVAEDVAAAAAEEMERAILGDETDAEPLVDGHIEVGRIVYEHVAAAIDPYPRKEGAVFEWREAAAAASAAGPFAALAKLKKQP